MIEEGEIGGVAEQREREGIEEYIQRRETEREVALEDIERSMENLSQERRLELMRMILEAYEVSRVGIMQVATRLGLNRSLVRRYLDGERYPSASTLSQVLLKVIREDPDRLTEILNAVEEKLGEEIKSVLNNALGLE